MTEPSAIRAALEESFDALETLGADLGPAEWQTPSLCPDWTVRGVFEHVVGIENALVSWLPDAADTPPPFSLAAAFAREVAELDAPTFMERARRVLAHRRHDLSVLDPSDLARPSWTPVGPGSYGRFMEIRVFDLWVHERDISTPLGRPTDDTGVRAEIALAEVEGSLGYIVGKKVGLPEGRSIVFHLSGPIGRDIAVVVDGRARVVEEAPSPDVEIWTDTLTFIQLACGRFDPQEPIDLGAIHWHGDAEFGERAARHLRFTM
ncbi:MAG TPA: maleylpyruvate isomerase family mycothiol-dependent enzyme [Acidimicrobiales bacterium]|nr:maleylpyruvate isomerase family mycothiol-dependent enzyme [Acidimicrobiales bacterium]